MSLRSATWTLQCWIRVRIGLIGRRFTAAIATRVVTFIDPQKADLELQAADGLVDVVAQPGVEHGAVVAAHLVRLLGRDSTWPMPSRR